MTVPTTAPPLASVIALPRMVQNHRDLLGSFVWRDLAARYEGSLLGRAWPLVYPLMLLAIYHLVFATFLGLKFGGQSPLGDGWAGTIYMLSGILPWLAFAEGLAKSTSVVLDNSNLIKKIAFPSELLPTYVSVAQSIHLAISLALFLALYLVVQFTAGDGVGAAGERMANLVFLPIPVILQFCFGLGLGFLLATVNVYLRDLQQMVPVGTLLWMLISPIFYGVELVERQVYGWTDGAGVFHPGTGQEWMLTLVEFNPVYHLLVMYRSVFRVDAGTAFPWNSCAIFAGISFVVLAVGHHLFVRSKGSFADEV